MQLSRDLEKRISKIVKTARRSKSRKTSSWKTL